MSVSERNPLHLKLHIVVKRDLLTAVRGSMSIMMRVVYVAVELVTFYYLARAVGPAFRPEGLDYFWFLLTGTAIFELLLASVRALIRGVRDAQISGVLEALMATSTRSSVVILLEAFSNVAGNFFHAFVYVSVGVVLFQIPLPDPNWGGTAAVLLLAVIISLSIGLLAAGMQIWLQKGDAVVALLTAVTAFLSGVLFSVDALPGALRMLANLNPIAHALTGFRAAFLKGASWGELSDPLMVLGGYCVVLLPLGFWLFRFALDRARRTGSLLFY